MKQRRNQTYYTNHRAAARSTQRKAEKVVCKLEEAEERGKQQAKKNHIIINLNCCRLPFASLILLQTLFVQPKEGRRSGEFYLPLLLPPAALFFGGDYYYYYYYYSVSHHFPYSGYLYNYATTRDIDISKYLGYVFYM